MAARRITNAAARLQAADRALLELSVTRGLDDTRIAQLTGMPAGSVSSRRRQILETLAAELDLAPEDVVAALRADETPIAPTSVAALPSATPAAPEVGVATGHRRRPWIIAALLAGAVAVLLVLVLTANGTPRHRLGRPPQRAVPVRPRRAVTVRPRRAIPVRPPRAIPVRPRVAVELRPLPGGLDHASGMLRMTRIREHLTLTLRLRLPQLHHGHYEAFLYTSILDSQALGRVRPDGVTRLRLPADAPGYRQIDVSDQPRGMSNPSGESRLRGRNPARAGAGAH
jgi:hypothetical protein